MAMPDGPATADGTDEKWSCHAPHHPVSPVKNGPVLWKGGGAEGISPGTQTDKILGQVADGGDAGLNGVAGFSTTDQHVKQQGKEQVRAGRSQL